jgi:hypothetical protein
MIRGDKKDSDILRRYCGALIDNIEATGQAFESADLTQRTYLNLLRRIQYSLLGVAVQLERWPAIVELKLPISLIFRTALTDALTGLYLATFHADPVAFQNELLVLDADYVKFVKTIIENTDLEMPGSSATDVAQETQARWANLQQKAAHLLREAGSNDLKSAQTLRATSDPALFQVPGNFARRLGEKEMFEQIKAHPDTQHLAYFYLVQRQLSQQHHYAPANSDFIELPPAYDCAYWFKSLASISEIAGALAGLLGAPAPVLSSFRSSQAALLDLLADRAE